MQSKNGMTSSAIPFFASGGMKSRKTSKSNCKAPPERAALFFVFLCKKPLHRRDAAAVNGKYFTKMGREN